MSVFDLVHVMNCHKTDSDFGCLCDITFPGTIYYLNS